MENKSSRASSLTNNVFQQLEGQEGQEGQDQGINIPSHVFRSNTEADVIHGGNAKQVHQKNGFLMGSIQTKKFI